MWGRLLGLYSFRAITYSYPPVADPRLREDDSRGESGYAIVDHSGGTQYQREGSMYTRDYKRRFTAAVVPNHPMPICGIRLQSVESVVALNPQSLNRSLRTDHKGRGGEEGAAATSPL